MEQRALRLFVLALAAVTFAGCFGSSGGGSETSSCSQAASGGDDDDDDAGDDHPEPDDATLEESDLYRLDGNTLYVYSYTKGLAVLDVSAPSAPVLAGELALSGPAGELYAEAGRVSLVLEGQTAAPGSSVRRTRAGRASWWRSPPWQCRRCWPRARVLPGSRSRAGGSAIVSS